MIYIAHRGNVCGPDPENENQVSKIQLAIELGYEVEVDAWLTSDGFFLGHDAPATKVDRQFFQNKRIWTHCKNTAALIELSKYEDVNCFALEADEATITSRGFIWADGRSKTWDRKTVLVVLGQDCHDGFPKNNPPYGFCTDWPMLQKLGSPASARPFDLLILDIDGVMTSNKSYDTNGTVIGKQYCDLDFTAIKRFMAAGIKVCFLSGDKKVNEAMAATRKIPFFHNEPGVDKVDFLPKILEHYKTDKFAYVGDDYYDIQIMRATDFSFCPTSSPAAVKRAAKYIVPVEAGKGVVAGAYDMIESSIPYAFPRDSADVNPK